MPPNQSGPLSGVVTQPSGQILHAERAMQSDPEAAGSRFPPPRSSAGNPGHTALSFPRFLRKYTEYPSAFVDVAVPFSDQKLPNKDPGPCCACTCVWPAEAAALQRRMRASRQPSGATMNSTVSQMSRSQGPRQAVSQAPRLLCSYL